MKRHPSSQRITTRRAFLSTAARAGFGLAAGLSVPAILPRMGRAGTVDRIVVGHVGVGGRGRSLLGMTLGHKDVEVAAVCDVDRQNPRAVPRRRQRPV